MKILRWPPPWNEVYYWTLWKNNL